MKTLSSVLSSFVVFACASPSPAPSVTPVTQGALAPAAHGVLAIADAPASPLTPRARPAHTRAAPVFVDLRRLPPMRLGGCFAEDKETSSIVKGAPSSGGSSATRHRSLGSTSGSAGGIKSSAPSGRVNVSSGEVAFKSPQRAASPSKDKRRAPESAERRAPAPVAAAPATAAAPAPAAAPPPPPSSPRADAKKAELHEAEEREAGPVDVTAHAYDDYGASIYLSNDDTMSLSSAQRVIYAIDRFLPIPSEHIRPHELLNYFSFDTAEVAPADDFSVLAEIEPKPGEPGIYTLGLAVSGRSVSKAERRNAALTFVVDRSGSMSAEGRMEYLKRGLLRMTSELKRGDLVNLVVFDHEACTPLENFVVGRDAPEALTNTIQKLAPRGSTDIDSGLRLGYGLADNGYQPTHSNRVVLITDALANTGVTDAETIAMISSHYDRRRIRLSGVGVGSDFNDGLLDRLTERGKGAYVFLGSPSEVDAVFGDRFVSLIETTANDVHFKLQLPRSLRMNVFYGEESSTVKEDVQAIHYFAGTSQLFLSDLGSRTAELQPQDSVMLSIEYENPETGQKQFEDFAFELGAISGRGRNVKKARLVTSFIDGLADTVRSRPEQVNHRAGGWVDAAASQQCARGQASLAEQARPLASDPEVKRVVQLWDTYCSRYEAVRSPVRRTAPSGRDVWPSASR